MKTIAHYFLIRHKPTGFFIPPGKGIDGRGGSHVEPSDEKPKLFASERSAKSWLTTWLKGKVVDDSYTDRHGEFQYSLKTVAVPTRKREEMEIVPARLVA